MIVQLTGGIGCGKSSVARMFGELGATTVDADAIVATLYEADEVRTRVAEVLGLPLPITKADVARRVFGDDSALRSIEAVLHPLVHERIQALRAATPAEAVLVYEIPLPPTPQPGDVIVCVETDEGERVRRLRDRGMQDADIYARIAAAPGPRAYREHADHVITNDGDIEALRSQVAAVWKAIRDGARAL